MAGGATLALKITGDSRDAVRALDDLDGKAGRMDGVFGKMGAGIAGGVAVGAAAVVGLAKSAFDAASDLQQSTGAIDAVFGDWALDIEQSAQQASSAVGLSTSEYENLAAVIGAQLAGAGMAHDEMTAKTQTLITTGADLAATFGGTTADAVSALSGVMKGEFDPIERYGVSLKQSDINARLAADGNANLTGEALKTATANAALALITEQTASSQGMFASEAGTAAGAGEILSAKMDNLKAALGERLLPIFAAVATFISDTVIPYLSNLTGAGSPVHDMFDRVGAIIRDQVVPILGQLWSYIRDNVLPMFGQMSSFIRDNVVPILGTLWAIFRDYIVPVFQTILPPVIAGVRDAFQKISDKVSDNRDKFQNLYDKVKPFLDFMRDTVAPFIATVLTGAFKTLGDVIGPVIDTIAWVLDKGASLIGVIGNVGSFVGGLFGAAPAPAPRGAAPGLYGAAPGLFGAAAPMSSGGGVARSAVVVAAPAGDTYSITVTGALDPDAVADQIERMLTRRARMTGRAMAAAL